jgi:hypothetical protein
VVDVVAVDGATARPRISSWYVRSMGVVEPFIDVVWFQNHLFTGMNGPNMKMAFSGAISAKLGMR